MASLVEDSGFLDLTKRNIFRVTQSRSDGWSLEAGNCVGSAFVAGMHLRVVEKVPGALQKLLEIISPNAVKLANAETPIAFGVSPQLTLIQIFLQATRQYLSNGKAIRYLQAKEAGAFISGRLDIPATAQLRARGIRHKVAYQRSLVSDDMPLNRAVFQALGVLLQPGHASSDLNPFRAAIRTLRGQFSDASTDMLGESSDLVTRVAALADDTTLPPSHRELATLAVIILENGARTSENHDALAPRSWFINLENIYERALRMTLANESDGGIFVSGPVQRPPIFRSLPGRYRANPDIVVSSAMETSIIDAKYKNVSGWPSSADIHELLSHAAAYRAKKAALVYPAEASFSVRPLSTSATGCDVWLFQIPLLSFKAGGRSILASMDIPLA
jgi:5-methylcytosine-specific restriction endonuclease McrBC regulatory subunit McrC